MLRKRDPASDTSDSLPHLYTRRKRLQRQPSDDGRAHLARTIRQRMLCPICFVKNPALKRRVFARRTKKRPIGIRLPPRPAERMKRHSKSLSQPFYASKTTHIG